MTGERSEDTQGSLSIVQVGDGEDSGSGEEGTDVWEAKVRGIAN